MEHSFNIDVAKEYGVHSAILLNNIAFWCLKNKANGTHEHDGHFWTYNSKKAFSELFPYMTARQIDYALKRLIDDGILITGNFNTNAYDRTLWYAVTKKGYSILQNCSMDNTSLENGNPGNVEPIPDEKPVEKPADRKPDNKAIYVEIISYLNAKLGTSYRATTKATQEHINARLKDGFTVEDFRKVIDNRCKEWKGTKMAEYLRPSTLFGPKFEGYLNSQASNEQQNKNNSAWGNLPGMQVV